MCNQSETGFLTEKPGVANKVGRRKKRTFLKKSIWSFISGCSTQKKGDAIDLFLSRKCRKKKGGWGVQKNSKKFSKNYFIISKTKNKYEELTENVDFCD